MDRDKIAELLTDRGATKPCHRCGNSQFTVLDGYSNVSLQEDFNSGIIIGGVTIPVTYVACNNCGAITGHAVGALGLLPKEEGGNEEGGKEEGGKEEGGNNG